MSSILILDVIEEVKSWSDVENEWLKNPAKLNNIKSEEKSYRLFLSELKKRFNNVYIKIDPFTPEENKGFIHCFEFLGKNFNLISEKINPDLVFDLRDINTKKIPAKKVINDLEFIKLSKDKWKTYKFLKEYHPLTFLIKKEEDLLKIKKNFQANGIIKVIFKPRFGSCGEGIFVKNTEDISSIIWKEIKNSDYIVQEFKETKNGFQKFTKNRHDIRIQVCDVKPSLVFIRTPVKDSYVHYRTENIKQIKIKYSKIFLNTQKTIKKIINKIAGQYPNNHFAIDFGIDENGKFFIYEINTILGWPYFHPYVEKWAVDLSNMLYKVLKSK